MAGQRYLAMTRDVSSTLGNCELTHVERSPIDVDKAREQHRSYRECLTRLGVSVVCLPASDQLPDSVFVEDTAVVVDEGAVICPMGTPSRRREPPVIADRLKAYRSVLALDDSVSIEGGDVLRIGREFLVGQSSRTSREGIEAFCRIVEPWGYSVTTVPVRGSLHLKTALCAIDDEHCLVNQHWVDVTPLSRFDLLEVPVDEPFAANVLRVDEHIVVAQGHPRTAELLASRGYDVTTVDISELAKAEAGLTCLSLVFADLT